nr:heparin lyase I family protein [Thalassococcus sp. S3]
MLVAQPNDLAADPPPRGYAFNLSPHDHAYRRSEPGEPTRRGRRSERFELRDGDCGGSDCGNPRYRSELRMRNSVNKARINKDIWYGWSFYNETVPSFSAKTTLRTVFGTWKLSGDHRPIFRLIQMGVGEGNWTDCDPALCTRSDDRAKDVVIQLDDMRSAYGWGKAQNLGHICKLFSMAEMRGKWVDIVINTNFGTGPDGYLNVWINETLACSYRGQLVATPPASTRVRPGHRRGIFASYTKRWDANAAGQSKPRMVVYYDEFLSGRHRADVDPRLRELAGKRAKD